MCSPVLHRVLIISGHVRKALHICKHTEPEPSSLSLMFVCVLRKSTAVIQEKEYFRSQRDTHTHTHPTDLPRGSTVNDLFLSPNELNTEQKGTHV